MLVITKTIFYSIRFLVIFQYFNLNFMSLRREHTFRDQCYRFWKRTAEKKIRNWNLKRRIKSRSTLTKRTRCCYVTINHRRKSGCTRGTDERKNDGITDLDPDLHDQLRGADAKARMVGVIANQKLLRRIQMKVMKRPPHWRKNYRMNKNELDPN